MVGIRTEVEIRASPERVWTTFSDFEGLKQWQTWLTIHAPSNAAAAPVGSRLDVTLQPEGGNPFHVKPEVLTNTPQGEFKWRGKLWGSSLFFVGEHYFQVKPTPGGTVFVHGEEFRGCLVPLLGGVVKQAEAEFAKFNANLKKQVEGGK